MASEFEPYDDPSLKGLARVFNSKTIRGRANVAKATFGSIGLYFLYSKFCKKKCDCGETEPEQK